MEKTVSTPSFLLSFFRRGGFCAAAADLGRKHEEEEKEEGDAEMKTNTKLIKGVERERERERERDDVVKGGST